MTAAIKDKFSTQVRRSLDGSILRYSQRVRLLRQAAIMGIGRFEANLLIAMEEHKARSKVSEITNRQFPFAWITFAVTQTAILVLLCWFVKSLG